MDLRERAQNEATAIALNHMLREYDRLKAEYRVAQSDLCRTWDVHTTMVDLPQMVRVVIERMQEAEARAERAERALRRAGFVDLGAEEWKPPVNADVLAVMEAAREHRDAWSGACRCKICQTLDALKEKET